MEPLRLRGQNWGPLTPPLRAWLCLLLTCRQGRVPVQDSVVCRLWAKSTRDLDPSTQGKLCFQKLDKLITPLLEDFLSAVPCPSFPVTWLGLLTPYWGPQLISLTSSSNLQV